MGKQITLSCSPLFQTRRKTTRENCEFKCCSGRHLLALCWDLCSRFYFHSIHVAASRRQSTPSNRERTDGSKQCLISYEQVVAEALVETPQNNNVSDAMSGVVRN